MRTLLSGLNEAKFFEKCQDHLLNRPGIRPAQTKIIRQDHRERRPPTEALTLTAAEAAEIYHAVPARTPCEDGKPNRPLTAFTIVFVPVPDPAKELTSMGLMQAGPASAGPLECRGALAEHAVHLAGPQLGGISDVALVFRQ